MANPWVLNVIEPESHAYYSPMWGAQWTFLPDSKLSIEMASGTMPCSWKIKTTGDLEVRLPLTNPDGTPFSDIVFSLSVLHLEDNSMELLETVNDNNFLWKFSRQ